MATFIAKLLTGTETTASGTNWTASKVGGMVTLVLNACREDFTLPPGFLPKMNLHIAVYLLDGTSQRVIVNKDSGKVTIPSPGVNHYGTVSYTSA